MTYLVGILNNLVEGRTMREKTSMAQVIAAAKRIYHHGATKLGQYVYHPLIIHRLPKPTRVRKAKVPVGKTVSLNLENILGTPSSTATLSAIGNLIIYASTTRRGAINGPSISLTDEQKITYSFEDYGNRIGRNDLKKFVLVKNIGITPGKLTIKFEHLNTEE